MKLKGSLKIGDKIRIKGHKTQLEQVVASMQKDHKSVSEASKGEEIGLKVVDTVREKDIIYKQ